MNTIAKKALEMYVFENQIPTLENLGLVDHEFAHNKYANFVTVYLNGTIVGSSGRVHPVKNSTIEELLDNIVLVTQDPRFVQSVTNMEVVRTLHYRIDIVAPEYRRLVTDPESIDVSREGVIVLCQKQGKLAVILSGMIPGIKSGDELYRHALVKAEIDTKTLTRGDVLVYALRTKIYHDL